MPRVRRRKMVVTVDTDAPSVARQLLLGRHMEPIDLSRAEKALVIAGCIPLLLAGLLFLWA